MNNLFQKNYSASAFGNPIEQGNGCLHRGRSAININVPGSIAINPAAVANGAPLTGWIGLATTDRIFRCTDPA
ncbi:hypothetical protein [Dyella sp.]|uniref:hypothetical protein n=1 Tax=Dyella sp. TaxID=1869338 RepID=UPI002D76C646|nr:hypothetical protein [Dyella sp.]HET7329639.1 hypothetical protein [Dyella sp.]